MKHDIVTPSKASIKQPFHLKTTAEEEVQKMLRVDIMEPSSLPWASPVILVKKKDGSIQYWIDDRRLNAVSHKDSYPLPGIDDSLDALGKVRFFSTLDLGSGYWQICLTEEAKEKSAFCTPGGLYQFKVQPHSKG